MTSLLESAKQVWLSLTKWLRPRPSQQGRHRLGFLGHPLKVLCILREERDIANIFRMILEREECRVIFAADGYQGLELARLEEPDVVIVDELAPGMNGFRVYTAMKADARLCRVPLVFIADRPIPHQPWRRPQDKDIIHFPFSLQELIAAVEYVLTDKPRDSTPPYATLSDTR